MRRGSRFARKPSMERWNSRSSFTPSRPSTAASSSAQRSSSTRARAYSVTTHARPAVGAGADGEDARVARGLVSVVSSVVTAR